MALKVWLPLNGNLKNQGLSQFVPKLQGELMSYTAGKIGQCATFANDSSSYYSTVVTIPALELQELTVCLWIKPSAFTGTEQMFIREGLGYNGYGWAMSTSSSANTFEISMGNVGSTSDFVYTPGQWYHLAMTHGSDHHYRFYINGELDDEYINNVYNISYNETDGYISIGGRVHDGSYPWPFIGSLNDVRIYDEALSPKQIKEISKGLVAHYKLEGTGANPNLIRMGGLVNSGATSVSYDNSTDTYTIVSPVGTSTWGYGVNIGSTNKVVIPYNQKYRMSCEIWVPTEHKLVVDYNNYSNDSTVDSWNGNDNDLGNQRLTNSVIIPANTWTKVVMGSMNAHASNTTQTAIYEASKYGLYTNDDTESTTWYLRHFKVELGDKVTDWIPNIADAAYTTLGYDNMIVRDVSGNGYNGTVSGTLSYNVDSSHYSGSTMFNGSSSIVSETGSMAWCNFDNLTISTWLNPTTSPSSWSGSVGIQQDGGYTAGKIFSISNYAGKFSVQTDSSVNWVTTQSESLPLNTWSHCVAVLEDGTNLKMYLNGNLIKTTTLDWGTLTATAADTRLAIGVDLPGGDEYFTGSISDVRIYATALTADDILTLYKTSGIIDNKGNIYAYEFKEE